MTIRKNLLQITQRVLSAIDGQEVNSISDTDEAMQVAETIQNVFYAMVAANKFPEHSEVLPISSLGDSTRPTVFTFDATLEGSTVSPDRVKKIQYNIAETSGQFNWRTLHYVCPEDFLDLVKDEASTNSQVVTDVRSTATYQIWNDRMPTWWTSLDDEHVIMDAYDSTIEATLQSSKTRVMGTVIPVLSLTDTAVPDIDDQFHPLLLQESISACGSLYNEGADPKMEQYARRLRSHLQNDKHRAIMGNSRPNYGRRRR